LLKALTMPPSTNIEIRHPSESTSLHDNAPSFSIHAKLPTGGTEPKLHYAFSENDSVGDEMDIGESNEDGLRVFKLGREHIGEIFNKARSNGNKKTVYFRVHALINGSRKSSPPRAINLRDANHSSNPATSSVSTTGATSRSNPWGERIWVIISGIAITAIGGWVLWKITQKPEEVPPPPPSSKSDYVDDSDEDGDGARITIYNFKDKYVCSTANVPETEEMSYEGKFKGHDVQGWLKFNCDKTSKYDAMGSFRDEKNRCSGTNVRYLASEGSIFWDYKNCPPVNDSITTDNKN
jgi:hypothetical protein